MSTGAGETIANGDGIELGYALPEVPAIEQTIVECGTVLTELRDKISSSIQRRLSGAKRTADECRQIIASEIDLRLEEARQVHFECSGAIEAQIAALLGAAEELGAPYGCRASPSSTPPAATPVRPALHGIPGVSWYWLRALGTAPAGTPPCRCIEGEVWARDTSLRLLYGLWAGPYTSQGDCESDMLAHPELCTALTGPPPLDTLPGGDGEHTLPGGGGAEPPIPEPRLDWWIVCAPGKTKTECWSGDPADRSRLESFGWRFLVGPHLDREACERARRRYGDTCPAQSQIQPPGPATGFFRAGWYVTQRIGGPCNPELVYWTHDQYVEAQRLGQYTTWLGPYGDADEANLQLAHEWSVCGGLPPAIRSQVLPSPPAPPSPAAPVSGGGTVCPAGLTPCPGTGGCSVQVNGVACCRDAGIASAPPPALPSGAAKGYISWSGYAAPCLPGYGVHAFNGCVDQPTIDVAWAQLLRNINNIPLLPVGLTRGAILGAVQASVQIRTPCPSDDGGSGGGGPPPPPPPPDHCPPGTHPAGPGKSSGDGGTGPLVCLPDTVPGGCCPPPIITCPPPPPPPPPPEPMEYVLWQQCSTGMCQCRRADESSPGPDYDAIGHYRDAAACEAVRAARCAPCPGAPPIVDGHAVPRGTLNWDDPGICQRIDAGLAVTRPDNMINDWLGKFVSGPPARYVPPGWTERLPLGIRQLTQGVIAALGGVVAGGSQLVGEVLTDIGCPAPAVQNLGITRALIGFVANIFGGVGTQVVRPMDHTLNYMCPYELPSPNDAIQCYLHDTISIDLLRCWTRGQGMLWGPTQRVVEAARARPSLQEVLTLWRRDIITLAECEDRIRQLGYLYSTERDYLRQLTEAVPQKDELMRFMVRDVADPSVVSPAGEDLDFQFGQKWTGDVRRWGKWQGVSDDYARNVWRAHWRVPSMSAILTWFVRHRTYGTPIAADPLYPTVERALRWDDVAPKWVPRIVDLAIRPINRLDLRRSYGLGALDLQGVREGYVRLGYSDLAADDFARATYLATRRQLTHHPWVKLYTDGGAPSAQTIAAMRAEGFEIALIQDVMADAMARMKARTIIECIKALRRRFLQAEFGFADALIRLQTLSLDADQSAVIANRWVCELSSRGKFASAGTLCRWFQRGLISAADYLDRLEKLGWSNVDATNHIAACLRMPSTAQLCTWLDQGLINLGDYMQRLQTSGWSQTDATLIVSSCASKILARRQRELDREIQRQSRQQRQQQAAARRCCASAKSDASRALAANTRRQRLVLNTSALFAQRFSLALADALAEVRDTIAGLRHDPSISLDTAIQAVVIGTESDGHGSIADWRNNVGRIALDLVTGQPSPAPDPLVPCPPCV